MNVAYYYMKFHRNILHLHQKTSLNISGTQMVHARATKHFLATNITLNDFLSAVGCDISDFVQFNYMYCPMKLYDILYVEKMTNEIIYSMNIFLYCNTKDKKRIRRI